MSEAMTRMSVNTLSAGSVSPGDTKSTVNVDLMRPRWRSSLLNQG